MISEYEVMVSSLIIDLDYTLLNYLEEEGDGDENYLDILYPNTISILETLRQKNYELAIASLNIHAPKLLEKHNIDEYFGVISCGYKGDGYKLNHMKEIMENYPNIGENRIVLFDDDRYNFTEINLVTDIKTIVINQENGVTFDDINFLI